MQSALRWSRRWLPWLLGGIATVIALRSLLRGGGDLGIYIDVGREMARGAVDIYRDRGTVGAFAYPHFAGLPFWAVDGLLSDRAIRIAWCLSLGLATAMIVDDLRRAVALSHGLRPWQWLLCAVLFQRCVAQNLTHGQLSLWVAACTLRGIRCLLEARDARAGAWLGIATALKLTPGLYLVALPAMVRWRAAIAMAAALGIAVAVVPWPVLGTAEHVRHLQQFKSAVLEPLWGEGQAVVTKFGAGPSIAGTLDYLLQPTPVDAAGRTVNILALDDVALAWVKRAWAALLAALLGAWFWHARRLPVGLRLAEQSAAVMLAIGFFSPLTRVYHLAGALLAGALFCRGPHRRADVLWWIVALALALAMPLRQKALLGETLWRALDVGGLLHFALVGMSLWLMLACRSAPNRQLAAALPISS
jgi:alpha-1,2-mannosyltransferase